MGTGEETLVTLSGGAPWGFRLHGGSHQNMPLRVAKVRKRGKACRGGLRENDILLTINGRSCSGISHADAMNIIDSSDGTLRIWVKRVSCSPATGSFQSETRLATAPCERSQDSSKAPRQMPEPPSVKQGVAGGTRAVRSQPESYTSPPDSEAYYGETDSDADHPASERQRRQRKRWPAPRTPVRGSADEASEQSEYDSAPEPVRSPLNPLSPEPGASTRLDLPSLAQGVIPRMFQPRKVEAKINIWQPKVEVATYPKPSLTHPIPTNPTTNPNLNPSYPNFNPTYANPSYPNPSHSNPNYANTSNPIYANTWSAQSSGEDSALRQGVLGTSEADSGFQEVPAQAGSPEQKLLPTASVPSLRETQLVPMVGPVNNPVDEVLTTTYKQKAKQAKLHRSESVQEKQAKEARTKCKTIASLLTSAPNPHSKGVLMFKKRRQRAKKYTLVSYGSVDEEKQSIDEDGELLPTSESEFDEEAFSDAKSLTNQSMGSDWDSSYLNIEKPKSEPQGLTETKGKGVMLFEHQRQRAKEYILEEPPTQTQHSLQIKPKTEAEVMSYSTMNGDQTWPRSTAVGAGNPASDTLNYYTEMNLSPRVRTETSLPRPSEQHHSQHVVQGVPCLPGVANWTARPFTPGFQQSHVSPLHSISAPVLYRRSTTSASLPKPWEQATGQNKLTKPFSPPSAVVTRPTVNAVTQPEPLKASAPMRMGTPYSPASAVMSPPPAMMSPPPAVMSPPPTKVLPPPTAMSPSRMVMSPLPAAMSAAITVTLPSSTATTAEHTVMSPNPAAMVSPTTATSPDCTVASPPAAVMSPPPAVMSPPPAVMSPPPPLMTSLLTATPYSAPQAPITSTATFRISSTLLPQRESGGLASAVVNTPSIGSTSSTAWTATQPSESLATREQRISVPASKTGILQEARRRSTRKPMFTKTEQKKTSPNPELLSLVQNLDDKKPDHIGAGFESGPEEDFLSLGAEASNFMQSQARRQSIPPPVAPKPYLKPQLIGGGSPVVNGTNTPATLQLKGKGAELFAKRQSRMDKFIVDSVPTHSSQPRGPSPTPSLPATWKYSPNIRAPPPIGYNPIYSPSYPLAASKSQAASAPKTEKKWKPTGNQKVGIKAIDFMRRQPYQLNPAMFSFDESNLRSQGFSGSAPTVPLGQQSFISTKQVPVKTTRACEIRRFSTPVPTITPTVIAPRSATTLAEPVWMSAPNCPPPVSPKVSNSNGLAPQYGRAPGESPEVSFESSLLQFSPKEDMQVQKKASIPVPRPRFSAVRGGSSTHTWRPGSLQQ
ncbi:synaptopodin 2-like protein [Pristis pectinata]|uniref:synaptopodin 2-like protein n=1 Tax=Pristis pectinata TaxID=685728 RepID=UPI00223CBECB|nr:synaptopodin 2-like protein [Pristis pectinata]